MKAQISQIDDKQVNESGDEFLQIKITQGLNVFIQSIDKNVPLSQPVYAINWFNTRMLWLYNFYNLLGSVSVKKVGGKAFFKGRVKRILYGNEAHRRDVLLIVNYPAVNNFKQMLESTYFKLVSLLRMLAVKQFTFGFSCRTDVQKTPASHDINKAYAIHHYLCVNDIAEKIVEVTQHHGVEVYFSGRITSLLFSGDKAQAKDQVPCLMDAAVVLQADTQEQLENLIVQNEYLEIVQQTQSSFVATLDRVF